MPRPSSRTRLLTLPLSSRTVFAAPSPGRLIVRGISRFVPQSWLSFLYERTSSPDIQRLRENRRQVHEFAGKLIEFKRKALEQGKGQKDIMSLLRKFLLESRLDWG